MKSTEVNITQAKAALLELNTFEDITAYIEGEERKTVIEAADKRLKNIMAPKQGEQAEPITKTTDDFKTGVQKTKSYITCEDVLVNLRENGYRV